MIFAHFLHMIYTLWKSRLYRKVFINTLSWFMGILWESFIEEWFSQFSLRLSILLRQIKSSLKLLRKLNLQIIRLILTKFLCQIPSPIIKTDACAQTSCSIGLRQIDLSLEISGATSIPDVINRVTRIWTNWLRREGECEMWNV